jgi:protein-L-isoaspartate(D-aspartate) O-methyltransferase
MPLRGIRLFRWRTLVKLIWVLSLLASTAIAAVNFGALRERMVEQIIDEVALTAHYIDKEALDPQVMEAMARVPRHQFVPKDERGHAYENRPVPIGYGQTISQPYIVALMTDMLRLKPGDRVLEVGTGSGYQAAILADLGVRVFTVEIIEELGKRARADLQRLGYSSVTARVADGYYGWPEEAPFDGIVVTAASSHVPPPLIKQLRPGGRMVIPVGGQFQVQQLMLVEKSADGKVKNRQVLPVRFVPLTGGH